MFFYSGQLEDNTFGWPRRHKTRGGTGNYEHKWPTIFCLLCKRARQVVEISEREYIWTVGIKRDNQPELNITSNLGERSVAIRTGMGRRLASLWIRWGATWSLRWPLPGSSAANGIIRNLETTGSVTFGQVLVQFMMVWHLKAEKESCIRWRRSFA